MKNYTFDWSKFEGSLQLRITKTGNKNKRFRNNFISYAYTIGNSIINSAPSPSFVFTFISPPLC